jgi:hypothetical protein
MTLVLAELKDQLRFRQQLIGTAEVERDEAGAVEALPLAVDDFLGVDELREATGTEGHAS